MEIAGFAVRDIIIVVCVLVAVYVAVTLLRLMKLRQPKPAPLELLPPSVPTGEADDESTDDEETFVYTRPVASPPAEAPSFGEELGRSQLEREVRQQREEVAALRAEVTALRSELVELKAASRVSPQYSDAMSLAQRGLTAQDIADRCGISLGEAELVWALARGGPQDYEEDEYGGEPGRNPARPQ